MQEKGAAPGPAEPSLDELRRMFEEKERVRETERRRLSRLATKVLLGLGLVLLVSFLMLSGKPGPEPAAQDADAGLAEKAAEIQRELAHRGAVSGPGGGAGTAEADARRGDIKFALDLMRYVNPENVRPKPGDASPSAPEGK